MKKILYFATVDMFTRNGGGLATQAYYNALNAIFPDKIDLFHAEDYIPENLKNEENIILSKRISTFHWIRNILTGHFHRFYPSFINYLKDNKDKYSICVINGSQYVGDTIEEIKKMGIKVIVIHHNHEVEYVKANKNVVTLWGLLINKIRKLEYNAYKNADINLFLTKSDSDLFKKKYGNSDGVSYVIGTFELSDICLPHLSNDLKYDLVISGALNFKQTIHGIVDLYDNYLDIINDIIPNAKILITGRNPGLEIERISKISNFDLVANPDDIFEFISMGNIYICPIDVGGGLKLRIMDGLKLGMPILTHECSARGYEDFFNKPYFKIYKDKLSFERGFRELLKYISTDNYSKKEIQTDYLNTFSFNAGVNRFRCIFNKFNI